MPRVYWRIRRAKARPAIVSIHDSLQEHFIYLRIINAHPTLVPIKKERILHDIFMPRLSIIFAMHVALGFITIIALELTYNKEEYEKYLKKHNKFLVCNIHTIKYLS